MPKNVMTFYNITFNAIQSEHWRYRYANCEQPPWAQPS